MQRRAFIASSLAVSLFARIAQGAERKYRVAVIGHTGQGNYGHALDTAWQIPEAEIVAVADADPAGLAAAQKRLNLTTGFADYRDMLAKTKPEIVSIAPRSIHEHRDMALAALEAGAKGIYIEKPFCRTLAEADEIIAACEKQHAKLAVAHRNRYHPALPTIKKLMDAGQFGKLLEMRARGKEDARGGALDLWVLGSHDFNLMHLFAGAPVACAATLLQNGKPATKTDIAEGAEGVGPLLGNELHARYEFENGVTGYFDSITKAWEKGDGFGLQLIFTKGIVNLRIDVDPIAHWIPGNPFRPDSKPRPWLPITSVGIDQPEVIENVGKFVSSHAYAVSDLCRAMVENRQPLCSAYDGRVTVEMISAVFESHRLQGQRIALPLTSRDHPVTRL